MTKKRKSGVAAPWRDVGGGGWNAETHEWETGVPDETGAPGAPARPVGMAPEPGAPGAPARPGDGEAPGGGAEPRVVKPSPPVNDSVGPLLPSDEPQRYTHDWNGGDFGGYDAATHSWRRGKAPAVAQSTGDPSYADMAERFLARYNSEASDRSGRPDRGEMYSFYNGLADLLKPRISEEEQARRERGAWASASYGALGQAMAAIGNLIYAGKAPSQKVPDLPTPYKKIEALRDKLDAVRARYMNAKMAARSAANSEYGQRLGEWNNDKESELRRLYNDYNLRLTARKADEAQAAAQAAAEYDRYKYETGRQDAWSAGEADRGSRERIAAGHDATSRGNAQLRESGATSRAVMAERGRNARSAAQERGRNARSAARLSAGVGGVGSGSSSSGSRSSSSMARFDSYTKNGVRPVTVDMSKLTDANYQQLYKWLSPAHQRQADYLLQHEPKSFNAFVVGHALQQSGEYPVVNGKRTFHPQDVGRSGEVFNYLTRNGAVENPYAPWAGSGNDDPKSNPY